MKKQETKTITEYTSSKIKSDFKEVLEHYPFSKMVSVSPDEIHFEVYAVSKEEIQKLGLKKSAILKEEYSKRLYLILRDDYCKKGPTVYSMEKWTGLEKIPYESKHFYEQKTLVNQGDGMVCKRLGLVEGRGYETCTSVSKANRDMENPLLENIKSAEMLLCSYELFLRGLNKEVVVRQYKHGDEGVQEYERERRNGRN